MALLRIQIELSDDGELHVGTSEPMEPTALCQRLLAVAMTLLTAQSEPPAPAKAKPKLLIPTVTPRMMGPR